MISSGNFCASSGVGGAHRTAGSKHSRWRRWRGDLHQFQPPLRLPEQPPVQWCLRVFILPTRAAVAVRFTLLIALVPAAIWVETERVSVTLSVDIWAAAVVCAAAASAVMRSTARSMPASCAAALLLRATSSVFSCAVFAAWLSTSICRYVSPCAVTVDIRLPTFAERIALRAVAFASASALVLASPAIIA